MAEERYVERVKSDYKDLESLLVKNDLLDDRRIWFAGYDNHRKATNNAIAGNLLYGYSRLNIMCIKDHNIYLLHNTKRGFLVRVIGSTEEKNKATSFRHIMYPVVDFTSKEGKYHSVKVVKHKESIKEFKQTVKNK